ncbi:hypothetical protein HPB50_007602 [Hyalomma asiaticum]|uniref:Uncharacterized protein n=1 Tax=Hyalomma asiaticum TaxID=266040 RepID=A0ACB7RVU9_HYAAI|nr:hypothetical protein HPB50_007602 [Hyalomma asiaticum]
MPPTRSIRGHLELLACDFHKKKCLEWAKEYGPVIRAPLPCAHVSLQPREPSHLQKRRGGVSVELQLPLHEVHGRPGAAAVPHRYER